MAQKASLNYSRGHGLLGNERGIIYWNHYNSVVETVSFAFPWKPSLTLTEGTLFLPGLPPRQSRQDLPHDVRSKELTHDETF